MQQQNAFDLGEIRFPLRVFKLFVCMSFAKLGHHNG